MASPGGREGLFAALRNIGITLLAMGQTRLELLGNEIEIQKVNAVRMLLLAQAMVFCAALGIVLSVAWVALLLWDQRLVVVAVFAGIFLAAAAWCYRALVRILNTQESAFSATLAELREDMRRLKTASGHATKTD